MYLIFRCECGYKTLVPEGKTIVCKSCGLSPEISWDGHKKVHYLGKKE